MENKNLTAVEWLIEFIQDHCIRIDEKVIEQAKSIEKEQIKNAFDDSELHNTGNDNCSEIYYNEIYKK